MATVRYTVVDGEILAEKRIGVRRSYVPDPLGSTVALLNNGQAITDTFSYRPYGYHKSRTGTTETPFRFGGTLGYYHDVGSGIYVRARYYSPGDGRWQTEDPLLFSMGQGGSYSYASNNPTSAMDPSGLLSIRQASTPNVTFQGCTKEHEHTIRVAIGLICSRQAAAETCFQQHCCASGTPKTTECFSESCDGSFPLRIRCKHDKIACKSHGKRKACGGTLGGWIYICDDFWTRKCGPTHCELMHEMIHNCGPTHFGGPSGASCYNCPNTVFPSCPKYY